MPENMHDSVARLLSEWQVARPDLDPAPVGIQGRITRLSAYFQRRAEEWLKKFDLTWEAFSLIVTLRRAGAPYELRPTDIRDQSLLTFGAITNRIDRVEAMGLIERRADKNDRRSYIIRLTRRGKGLADEAIAHQFASLNGIMSVLSKSERMQLTATLSKLLLSFERSNTVAAPKTSQKRSMAGKKTRHTTD
ncbi:MAG TPA: MarR family transcriptional regulator [Xanthobacteraceae bacterium]|jgi:DNA-binding MarR family transcriptional regulator|nr:MarR family transcriptional regulator [Xanthobacteraceae bacterium]